MQFHLAVIPSLQIPPLPDGAVLRNEALAGKLFRFSLGCFSPREYESSAAEVSQTTSRKTMPGWEHAHLCMASKDRIPASFQQFILLFPGTVIMGKDKILLQPCMVFEGGDWICSTIRLQVSLPLNARYLAMEAFE